jgi:hypothetical protein
MVDHLTVILYLWTSVVAAGTASSLKVEKDWRPIGEYHSWQRGGPSGMTLCENAAKQLGLEKTRYRCVISK